MLSGRFFVAGAALCPGVLSSLLLEGHACPNDSFKHYHLADVRVKVGYSVHLEHQSRGAHFASGRVPLGPTGGAPYTSIG